MRIEITGRHVAVSPGLRTLVDRKLARVLRRLNNAGVSAAVIVGKQRQDSVVEVTLHARGEHFLHAVGKAREWSSAADAVAEKLERQAEKLKTRWNARKRKGAPPTPPPAVEDARPERPSRREPQRIVRASRYPVKPMTVEEAALELDAQDAAFVVFRAADTGDVNVVYRRKNGQVGLIEPEA